MGLTAPFSVAFYGFLVVSLFFKEAESCPRDWTSFKGFCYGLFNDLLIWAEAEMECHKKGGHLASVHSEEEMVHISKNVQTYIRENKNVWIGLHIDKRTKNWVWVDQSPIRYQPWDDGEPNNFLFKENCAELSAKKDYVRWNDKNCSKTQPYVCKTIAV